MTTLIVGGYGSVGQVIVEKLATGPNESTLVIIAGRNSTKANAVANEFGSHVSGVGFNLRDTDANARILKDLNQVVMCVDQSDPAFVEACLERGIDYIDITASDDFFRQVEQLDGVAQDNSATAVLSVGLAPGVTNLLAKRMVDQLSTVSEIRIGVLLGLGEAFGPAAIRWTLEQLGQKFVVTTGRRSRSVRGFSNPELIEYPLYGRRRSYRFDFADQHVLHRTLGVPARTYLCFDSRAVTSLVYGLSRFGLYRPVVEMVGLDRLAELTSSLSVGVDGFAVTVAVVGKHNSTSKTLVTALDGHEQSQVTGTVAAIVSLAVHDSTVPDGIHHVHEILDPEPILDMLRNQGYRLTNSELIHGTEEPSL